MTLRMRTHAGLLVTGLLFWGQAGLLAQPGNEVRLKRAWVAAFADRTSMDASMTVRHTHNTVKSVESGGDGDIHFSGESKDVGLPFVGEVVNAGLAPNKPVVALIKAKVASGEPVQLRGVWRLWFEHPAKKQTQGGQNAFYPDNTNPDHSFEIHPAFQVDQMDLTGSFIPIPGLAGTAAEVAFARYEKAVVTIKASASGISIRAKKIVYNYVKFEIELTQKPKKVQDGFIALADVFGEGEDELTGGPIRMIIVEGTPAADVFKTAASGDRFRVLGMPRINLRTVLTLVEKNGTKQFEAPLPYEMVIIGVR